MKEYIVTIRTQADTPQDAANNAAEFLNAGGEPDRILPVTTDEQAQAAKYIRAIRNQVKRNYAEAYRDFLLADQVGDNPPDYTGLSGMAAQCVRLRLHKMLGRA